MNSRKYTIFSILFLFFLSALMMIRQLSSPGYFSCISEDTYTYTSWAWQFTEALKEGVVYPRWLPLSFWGYGGPIFILYPPLAFYIAAFFNVISDSVITAMNMTKFIALYFSGLGMFFLVKEFYSEKIALLTASFYIVFPYQIFQFYYVGTFASTISFMWFSIIILFAYRYMKNRHYKDVLYAGICYGCLILTHLINAYMFTFVLVAFILYMSISKKKPKDLILIPLILIIGSLISAAYIVPIIYEKKFLYFKYLIGEGGGPHFAFHNFFIIPNLTSKLPSDHLWAEYYDTFVFFIFFFCVLISLFLLQIIKLRHIQTDKDITAVNKFFLGAAVLSIFLLFGLSKFLWDLIPFFEYIQFPSRWLNITVFAVVFLSAVIFWAMDALYKTKIRHNLFIVLLFLICIILDYKYISAAYVFPKKTLEPVKEANWNLEHLPRWVNVGNIFKHDFENKILVTKGDGKAEIITWESTKRVIDITSQTPISIWIRTFNFPGWEAFIDGKQTEIKTEEDVGAMLIDIPEGSHTLVLKFEDTPIRYYSKIVSLVSLFIMVLFLLVSKRLKRIQCQKQE